MRWNEAFASRIAVAFFLVVVAPSVSNAQFDTTGYHVHTATTADERLFLQINHWGLSSPGLDWPMVKFSNTAAAIVVALPVGLYGYGLIEKDDHAAYAGIASALSVGLSTLITTGIKEIVRRPRPYHEIIGTVNPSDVLSGGYSFPSGHATGAFALATSLSLYYPKWYVIAPSALWAMGVAISRPYLGVHYPSDILVGAIIGTGIAFLVYHYDHEWGNALHKLLPNGMVPASSIGSSITDPNHMSWSITIPLK